MGGHAHRRAPLRPAPIGPRTHRDHNSHQGRTHLNPTQVHRGHPYAKEPHNSAALCHLRTRRLAGALRAKSGRRTCTVVQTKVRSEARLM